MPFPDFLIIGAPKAGSTAVHAALQQHPQLFLSTPKEPKFFLTGGKRPDPRHHRGPGDLHSSREWVWDRARYEALFDNAPYGALRGESTPFYLWDRQAHRRIHAALPDVKMIAVLRDPVTRAYSNWTHLWGDGLEPEADFLTAVGLERQRAAAGYAPFWRYVELGLYGHQLQHLYRYFSRDQVFVLRYRRLIDDSEAVLDEMADFLGVERGLVSTVPRSNVSKSVPDAPATRRVRTAIRAGATVGAHLPPRLWREAQKPLLRAMHTGSTHRPHLSLETRQALLPAFADDIRLLSRLTDRTFEDWLSKEGPLPRLRVAAGHGRTGAAQRDGEAEDDPKD